MGKGIDAAKALAPEHAAMMEDLRDQLLIVFLRRMGGSAHIPVKEVDDTGDYIMVFSIDPATKIFHFAVEKKQ